METRTHGLVQRLVVNVSNTSRYASGQVEVGSGSLLVYWEVSYLHIFFSV